MKCIVMLNQVCRLVPPHLFGDRLQRLAVVISGTNKMYGYVGNSFVAVVEFGKEVKAKSVLAGGNNRNPSSLHFQDQALLYSQGKFKDVWFYKKDVVKHAERTYHPGDKK